MPQLPAHLKFITSLSLSLLFTVGLSHAKAQGDGGDPAAKDAGGFKFKTVIIDAGHGGKDPGAHGAFSKEKDIALSIAKKLKVAINESLPTLNVIMTRTTDNFVELQQRSNIANDANANLFISIHCNSSPQRVGTRKGTLLLVYGYHRKEEQLEALRENASIYQEKDYNKKYEGYKGNDPAYFILLNAFMQKYREQSIKFGKLVNEEFTGTDNRRSDGVHEQGLLVLAHSAMPAVLVETGFVNNPDDEKYLNSEEGQNEIVQSIVRALKKYRKSFLQNQS
jgi:N-acetylmuramoyl-L-alanine amidase